MEKLPKNVNILLIADLPGRATLLHDLMRNAGISGTIRRLSANRSAIDGARQSGAFKSKPLPELIFFDYSNPDARTTSILKKIAFHSIKPEVPIVLMVSPESEALLDSGQIDGGGSVMFSATPLPAFIRKMHVDQRKTFFKALRTLYQFGPILVRTPETALHLTSDGLAKSA